jgi:hypothetical protein
MQKWLSELVKATQMDKKGYFVKEAKIIELISRNKPIKTFESIGVNSIAKLLDKKNVFEVMCLTRIFEDADWHKRQYELYKLLQNNDFEKRDVSLSIFDPECFRISPRRLFDKKTIWADKIGGTIFGVPYSKKEEHLVPFMRISTRLFHYVTELSLHCEYISRILSHSSFGENFACYMKDGSNEIDFFDPHFLFEAFVWQFAMEKYFQLFEYIKLDLSENKKTGILYTTGQELKIISYDINDMVSNVCKERKFPGEHRMLSMKVKKSLLNTQYSDEQLFEILMKTLGFGSIFI